MDLEIWSTVLPEFPNPMTCQSVPHWIQSKLQFYCFPSLFWTFSPMYIEAVCAWNDSFGSSQTCLCLLDTSGFGDFFYCSKWGVFLQLNRELLWIVTLNGIHSSLFFWLGQSASYTFLLLNVLYFIIMTRSHAAFKGKSVPHNQLLHLIPE